MGDKLYQDVNLKIIFGITLMAVLGVASITPALPVIREKFGITELQASFLITVFTLPGVILTPVLGVLSDLIGRKRIVLFSLIIFTIAGGACAFVNDYTMLLILRFFQGVGTAALGSMNVTLIGDIYSARQRAEAMGYNSSVLSIGTGLYPMIGGMLAVLGWNYPFLLAFLGLPVGWLTYKKLRNPEPQNSQPIKEYLNSAAHNLIKPQVVAIFILTLFAFIILYGILLAYMPFLLANSFNATSVTIGAVISVLSFSTAVAASQLGKLSRKYTTKKILRIGFLFYFVGIVSIPFINNIWLLIIPIILYGIGQGINIPTIYSTVASLAPMNQRGVFMSVNGTILRLGQTIGPLMMGSLYAFWGIDSIFYAGAFIAFLGIILIIRIVNPEKEIG